MMTFIQPAVHAVTTWFLLFQSLVKISDALLVSTLSTHHQYRSFQRTRISGQRGATSLCATGGTGASFSSNQPQDNILLPRDDKDCHNDHDIEFCSTRRQYFIKSLSSLTMPALLLASLEQTRLPTANAFDNKTSNQYDDRPKRRGPQPKDLGVSLRKDVVGEEYIGLKPCGSSPNCFCSTDNALDDPEHSIPSWTYPKQLSMSQAFQQLKDEIERYKPGQGNIDGGGFKIVVADIDKGYIYVQFESLKNGYIDDVEFAYVPSLGENDVQLRSSSRIGYLDFGVNAKRINYIAEKMKNIGWKAPGVEYETHKGYFLENQVS